MDYTNSDKLIFILASPAGGGYRLGRIVCSFDNVHWYASKGNGLFPWSVVREDPNNIRPSASRVKGRTISKFHFDRRTDLGMIPLIGERIEKFWNPQDLDKFYNEVWPEEFKRSGGADILAQGKNLVWVLHDTPEDLEKRFPNAKIIKLIDNDIRSVILRYLTTTALFPFKIENVNLKPSTNNELSESLIKLNEFNKTPTYRDFWAWSNKNVPFYDDSFKSEYIEYISKLISYQQQEMQKENPKYHTVTWDNLNLDSLKDFIGAKSINENYKILLV